MNIIHSNGSKWAGEKPDSIEKLLDVLSKYALDPRFEDYGNFIQKNLRHGIMVGAGKWKHGDPIYPDNPGVVRFFGNFYELSHVFRIDTDEPETIEALTKAIRANKRTAAYKAAVEETVVRTKEVS